MAGGWKEVWKSGHEGWKQRSECGESSRSMYERGKEHLKDGKDRAEDSHQWKHWALDHPEIEGDPKFRLQIVSSFSDP